MAQRQQIPWRGHERLDDWKSRASTVPRDRDERGRGFWIATAILLFVALVVLIAYMASYRW